MPLIGPIKTGLLSLLLISIAGCGGNTSPSELSTIPTLEASESCFANNCHKEDTSGVTGKNIADEWLASAHNTSSGNNRSGRGASCGDCHEPDAGHPNSCAVCHGGGNKQAGTMPIHNPDSALKCDKCHALGSTVHPLDRQHINPRPLHYTNYTASYVSSRFIGKCRSCHNPHNPSGHMEANREWSESGHGRYTAKPWNYYDFKTRGTKVPATPANSVATDCVRCHTTTGYINYVTTGFTNISGWGKYGAINNVNLIDPTKQVLACPACHDDGNHKDGEGESYSFTTRSVPTVTGYYNYSSLQTRKMLISFPYPDMSTSNICIACHSGREIGATVFAAGSGTVQPGINSSINPTWTSVNFRNVSFVNSHYLTAGATIFNVSGYQFAGRSYNNPIFEHNQIGMGNYKGTGTKGPCVTCHMTSSTKHSFLPVTRGRKMRSEISGVTSTACVSCHPSPLNWSAETLQERKTAFFAALEALRVQLAIRGLYFYDANPYFYVNPDYDPTYVEAKADPHCQKNLPIKNWQTGGSSTFTWNATKKTCDSSVSSAGTAVTGQNNMGAAFNFNMLEHDPGAFAHNSSYVKQLIYDSIDWLDDNTMNDSTGVAINSLPLPEEEKTKAINYLLH